MIGSEEVFLRMGCASKGKVDGVDIRNNVNVALADGVIASTDDDSIIIKIVGACKAFAKFLFQRFLREKYIIRFDHSCFYFGIIWSVQCLYFPRT